MNDIADEMNVSTASIVSWESGRRIPSVETVIKLADLYGVSVDYLLGRISSAKLFCDIAETIDRKMIPFLHECPVFTNNKSFGDW